MATRTRSTVSTTHREVLDTARARCAAVVDPDAAARSKLLTSTCVAMLRTVRPTARASTVSS
jgi:hypothetical protein